MDIQGGKMKKFKKKVYAMFKSKNAYFFFVILFFILAILISAIRTGGDVNLGEFIKFDMVASISVTGIIGLLIAWIVRIIEIKLEDSIKLNDNYDELIKQYTEENFIRYKDVVIPVSMLYKIDESDKIKIIDNNKADYSLPTVCKQNYNLLFSAHKHSKVRNSQLVRLNGYEKSEKGIVLKTGRTDFFKGLVTNRACDFEIENGLTVRKIFEYKKAFSDLEDSQMSNHLGINGFIFTSDGYLIFIKRNNKKSIAKNKLGNSYGFGLLAPAHGDIDSENSLDYVYGEIDKHVAKVIGTECETKMDNVALIRTATECGKPSFVVNVTLSLTRDELVEKMKNTYVEKLSQAKVISSKRAEKAADKLLSEYIFAKREDVDISACDVFVIAGKKYASTPDSVAEFAICTGQFAERQKSQQYEQGNSRQQGD